MTLYYDINKVLKEQEYVKQKNIVKSADCIVNHDKTILMFDAKTSVPNTSLYINDQKQLKNKIRQYVECIQQMKKKIDDYGLYFKPYNFPLVPKTNIYAIIVVMQDSYILRDQIYDEYFKIEKIKENPELALFIKSHILILDIKVLEHYLFYGQDIYDFILKREQEKSFNYFDFSNSTNNSDNYHLNKIVMEFAYRKCEKVSLEIKTLQKNGFMPSKLKKLSIDT